MKRLIPIVVVSALVASCGGRGVAVQNPAPLQAAGSMPQTEWAIGQALTSRGWLVQSKQPGQIVAVYARRRHSLTVTVTYNQRAIQVYYTGSTGLKERRSGALVHVHPRVNAWLANLNNDIGKTLTEAQFVAPPAPPAGPPGPPPPPAAGPPAPPAGPPPPPPPG